jgi:hypothetical protein
VSAKVGGFIRWLRRLVSEYRESRTRTYKIIGSRVYLNGKELHGTEAEAVRNAWVSASRHMSSALRSMAETIDKVDGDHER